MIGLAIDQRRIDSGNGFVELVIEVESNHPVYFSQVKDVFCYMDQGIHI
jgi:hypothetical protein